MDIFRSATIAVAIILLIFMGMIMYYEFKYKVMCYSMLCYIVLHKATYNYTCVCQ